VVTGGGGGGVTGLQSTVQVEQAGLKPWLIIVQVQRCSIPMLYRIAQEFAQSTHLLTSTLPCFHSHLVAILVATVLRAWCLNFYPV
jgi:hypothetical protein